jgi:hypothetical protein
MNVLVFDLETRKSPPEVGWKNYAAQGISYGCAHLSGRDEFRLYGEETLLGLVEDMVAADLVVGFNILDFDLPLLRATVERAHALSASYINWDHLEAKAYDVLDDIRDSLGTKFAKGWRLDDVAGATLTCKKNGDGALAPGLWEAGRHAELCTYVLQDVKVERELWRHVLAEGWVRNQVGGNKLELGQIQKYRQAKELAPA